MTRPAHTLAAATALLLSLATRPALPAQVTARDLEALERHRKPRQAAPVLQSIEDADSTASTWTVPLQGTWGFLDAEEAAADAPPDTGADPAGKRTGTGETNGYAPLPSAPPRAMRTDATELQRRMRALPPELTVEWTPILELLVRDYVEAHAGALRTVLGRYFREEAAFRERFREAGIPEELAALAIVESAMNPEALSPAGALGTWQLMPDAAREWGLRCDHAVDERLDPLRSAEAAARLLRYLHGRLGDWPLALSAYNCGPQAVEAAMSKAGSRDYWKIYPYLPAETRGYVPAFVAALYSTYWHGAHGIEPTATPVPATATFSVREDLTFAEVQRRTGCPQGELARLNPQFLMGVIPGKGKAYSLRIPARYARAFRDGSGGGKP